MSEIKAEDPVEQALRTELILEALFKFLPVQSLLVSSQVNRLWKYQAQLYIRDHRKCTARMTSSSLCSQLKEVDQIIRGMAVVPYNSVHIFLGQHLNCSRAGASCTSDHDNFMSKLRLKHLHIMSSPGLETCPATFAVLRLLRTNESNIKSLCFQFMAPFLLEQLLRERLELPKLEELELQGMHEDFWETGGEFLQSITRATSRLKRIIHPGEHRILNILPQDKYHLLTKFRFNERDFYENVLNGREDPCLKLARSRPALTDLLFPICDLIDEQSIRACYEMLQLFLLSSCKSLESLHIYKVCPLLNSMITFPPLETLQNLNLHSNLGSDRFMELIQPIQFGRLFPMLQTVDLTSIPRGNPPQIFNRSPQLEDETEVEVVSGSPHSSASTSTMRLTADVCHMSFLQLKQKFPHVTTLDLNTSRSSAHAVPFRQIFRLWPHLKALTVSGQVNEELYNVDAEFCGIDQTEVELLWLMEEAELKNLHIVPRRPCPILMPSE